ncbi:MAG: ABC transporter permease [Candidatus Eisenbacteria bacterium]|uniref:ABC transporter permease n=1 Tax=Eiseniibacteriota bacterium TaxID=2212470 RepID=A0A937X6I8_UNCEI|nr:ABC transporter permease [Candidatus Eisenbacteria bacterium]
MRPDPGGARGGDLLRYAAGALRGHRLRTALSLTGVAIGVASVILLTSLGEGARLYVTGEFATLGSNLLIVLPGKTETRGAAPVFGGTPNDLTLADAAALARRIPQLAEVAPVSLGSGRAAAGERGREVVVIGTTHEMLAVRRLEMGIGRFLPPGVTDAPVCVIGAAVRRELFGAENPLGRSLRIGESRFRVIGVTAPRGTSIGMNLDEAVFVPVATGMRVFNRTGLFRAMVTVRSHADIESARRAVIALLAERHGGEEDVTVLTQDAVLATFRQILAVLTSVLAGIAAISLAVAGIGIMNVMLVSVSERRREIGLLKALGATGPQILRAFLLEAAMISTSGGALGVILGIGAGQAFRRLAPEFPIQPPPWAVAAALIVSLGVGLAFGGLPARRAARLDPVRALAGRGG